MSKALGSKLTALMIVSVFALIAVPAPAAAHDDLCILAVHIGPVTSHWFCDPMYKGDESYCVLNFNFGPVHGNFLC
jgi:hypothetical protein